MVQNGIRMEGITYLVKGLAKNPDIQHIDLQDNTFTVDGELSGVEAWYRESCQRLKPEATHSAAAKQQLQSNGVEEDDENLENLSLTTFL